MSSRKSNKFTESEVEQVAETVVEDVVTGVEELTDPEVIEQYHHHRTHLLQLPYCHQQILQQNDPGRQAP